MFIAMEWPRFGSLWPLRLPAPAIPDFRPIRLTATGLAQSITPAQPTNPLSQPPSVLPLRHVRTPLPPQSQATSAPPPWIAETSLCRGQPLLIRQELARRLRESRDTISTEAERS